MVRPEAVGDLCHFLESSIARELSVDGRLVRTTRLAPEELPDLTQSGFDAPFTQGVWFEHERIFFPSYPYEWAPEMLYEAACLTLTFAKKLLPHELGLKDATPYNVLFQGARAVFVDVLSVERRASGDPTWLPFAQFVRTFLLPLAVNRNFGISLAELMSTRRDGLEPEQIYKWLGPLRRLRSPYFTMVSIPTWLRHSARIADGSIYQPRQMKDREKAQFVLETLLTSLQKKLQKVRPPVGRSSQWSAYMSSLSYKQQDFTAKEEFVRECLQNYKPKTVLDVGCNDGHFSIMAARAGARVVGIDYEETVVGTLWRRASAEKLDILPLVVDLSRPTPSMGWRNRETASFLDRAEARFDLVLMLAVIHHMLVTERIPLAEILSLAADLTTRLAVVEYVSPRDTMFRQIARGREALHNDLTDEVFEQACLKHFEIVCSRPLLDGQRRVYLLQKRRATAN